MGSERSKGSEGGRRRRRRRKPMSLLCSLHSSCFASSSTSDDISDDDEQVCNGSVSQNGIQSRNQADDAKACYDKELKDKCDELDLDDDCGVDEEESTVGNVGSSIQEPSTSSRVFSHFKFIPAISRASSSRSFNTTYPVTSPSESAIRLNESPRLPVIDNVVRDVDAMRYGEDSLRSLDTRHVVREPSVNRNVRFSRTLSVGRLRDRVLRPSSLSDFTFRAPHQGEDDTDTRTAEDTPVTSTSLLNRSASSIRRRLFGVQERPSPLVREGLLQHRSDFLERRRRIRSQVRALQRLGNRFENITGHHDRTCVFSGRCTCRAGTNRGSTSTTDETNASASISRIVLLAETLFEVLDEIQQQSVVLSSQQPSLSSVASLPAPNDVVDLLPIKQYTKSQSEDSSQCYICLVEYEEGDTIRTLPCHHEFHRTCVDKWLKEIHRVCPLCRGDICSHDSSPEQH